MNRAWTFVVCSALIAPAMAAETTAGTRHVPNRELSAPNGIEKPGRVLRQDLFDRNNPNNLRSDWHAPPAQPGQY